jgi:hypothetical protein
LITRYQRGLGALSAHHARWLDADLRGLMELGGKAVAAHRSCSQALKIDSGSVLALFSG